MPNPTKVYVALPVYGGGFAEFWMCMMKMQAEAKVPTAVDVCKGDSLVSRARNHLTREFLNSDSTHLLFIDTDLIFSAEQIKRLVDHDEDIVAGFYPKKSEGKLNWVCNAAPGETKPDERGLQKVRYMGTGFMLVKREVFERMKEAYPLDYLCDSDQKTIEWDFWSVGVYQFPDGSRRYLSEDWYFCQRALDLGFNVWGDTAIILKHIGQAVYPLQSQQEQIADPSSWKGDETPSMGDSAPKTFTGVPWPGTDRFATINEQNKEGFDGPDRGCVPFQIA